MLGSATLTVVLPVYNEEAAIELALEEIRTRILDTLPGSDCLVIDDGSTDSTPLILRRVSELDPRVIVIRQENAGHGAAVRTGMEQSRGDVLFLLDSDRQIPIDAFASLWKASQGHEGAFGVRAVRSDPMTRVLLSRLIALTIRALFGIPLRDANVPFKVFLKSLWLECRDLIPEGTLAPSMFLAIHARSRMREIVEIEVPHAPRRSGVGSLRPLRLVTFCARGFVQIVAFRWKLGRERSTRFKEER